MIGQDRQRLKVQDQRSKVESLTIVEWRLKK